MRVCVSGCKVVKYEKRLERGAIKKMRIFGVPRIKAGMPDTKEFLSFSPYRLRARQIEKRGHPLATTKKTSILSHG